jgi:hypothetical protein
MEYNQGAGKLILDGLAVPRTTISVINPDTGQILDEGIIVRREGNWKARIRNVGSNLQRITVTSSNGCAIDYDVETDEHDDDEHDD